MRVYTRYALERSSSPAAIASSSSARFRSVDLHGSAIADIRGASALSNVTIGPDQIAPMAMLLLPSRNIRIDSRPRLEDGN